MVVCAILNLWKRKYIVLLYWTEICTVLFMNPIITMFPYRIKMFCHMRLLVHSLGGGLTSRAQYSPVFGKRKKVVLWGFLVDLFLVFGRANVWVYASVEYLDDLFAYLPYKSNLTTSSARDTCQSQGHIFRRLSGKESSNRNTHQYSYNYGISSSSCCLTALCENKDH